MLCPYRRSRARKLDAIVCLLLNIRRHLVSRRCDPKPPAARRSRRKTVPYCIFRFVGAIRETLSRDLSSPAVIASTSDVSELLKLSLTRRNSTAETATLRLCSVRVRYLTRRDSPILCRSQHGFGTCKFCLFLRAHAILQGLSIPNMAIPTTLSAKVIMHRTMQAIEVTLSSVGLSNSPRTQMRRLAKWSSPTTIDHGHF
ncbi:hypothetical protein EVAR_14176_1 [Eumeta japonica]|uniref:Uncharacterized protein n=1 Tax=Eumeta variegata TaxID=151549 RepID=A0A4C1UED5_EUMVA|nr:hypothetical protein EVAR_14176_1 [Eumeta japonica]